MAHGKPMEAGVFSRNGADRAANLGARGDDFAIENSSHAILDHTVREVAFEVYDVDGRGWVQEREGKMGMGKGEK